MSVSPYEELFGGFRPWNMARIGRPMVTAEGVQGRPVSLTITNLSLLVNLKGQGRLYPCPSVPMVFIVLSGGFSGIVTYKHPLYRAYIEFPIGVHW